MPASRRPRKARPVPPAPAAAAPPGAAGPAPGVGGPAAGVGGAAPGVGGPAAGVAGPAPDAPGPAARVAGPAAGVAGPARDAPAASPAAPDAMRRGYARSEQRNAAIRAGLTPLAPGERPAALLIAIGLSVFVAVANVAIWALGGEVSGQGTGAVGVLSFAAIMLAAAGGMWARRAWALLGFQALLAITIVFSFLALAVASNLLAVALCLVTIGGGGWLFWKLIRVLARMQAPGRPG